MTVQGSAAAGLATSRGEWGGRRGGAWCSPWRGLGGAALALTVVGCVASHPPVFPTASRLPDGERQPDAVAIDLPSEPPTARDDAGSDEVVIALRPPLGVDAARGTVRAFFQAIVREDVAALTALLLPGARVLDLDPATGSPAARRSNSQDARSWWSQRFRKHDYDQLETHVVYREADVETYRCGAPDAMPPAVAGATAELGPEPTASDVVLRIPIVTTTVRSERLLGDELYFWLRREGDDYRILHLAEPFPF